MALLILVLAAFLLAGFEKGPSEADLMLGSSGLTGFWASVGLEAQ